MALTETNRTGEFLASEANGTRSREVVTLLSGESVKAGEVLGKVTASGKYVAFNQDAATGEEAAAAIAYEDADASGGDISITVVIRDAEVNAAKLIWPSDITGPETTTALGELEALGIIARS